MSHAVAMCTGHAWLPAQAAGINGMRVDMHRMRADRHRRLARNRKKGGKKIKGSSCRSRPPATLVHVRLGAPQEVQHVPRQGAVAAAALHYVQRLLPAAPCVVLQQAVGDAAAVGGAEDLAGRHPRHLRAA